MHSGQICFDPRFALLQSRKALPPRVKMKKAVKWVDDDLRTYCHLCKVIVALVSHHFRHPLNRPILFGNLSRFIFDFRKSSALFSGATIADCVAKVTRTLFYANTQCAARRIADVKTDCSDLQRVLVGKSQHCGLPSVGPGNAFHFPSCR